MYLIEIMVTKDFGISFIFLAFFTNGGASQTYKGTVLGFTSLDEPSLSPGEKIEKNLGRYVEIVKKMSQITDILVFPDNGITTLYPIMEIKSMEHLYNYAIFLGNEGYNPCNNKSDDLLEELSCASKESNVNLVFNVIELETKDKKDNYYFTHIYMNNMGTIGKKWRKAIKIKETGGIEVVPTLNLCTFKINKGVEFLLAQFDDIVNGKLKANKNIILTSSTLDTLPLNYGTSLIAGLAAENQQNFLFSRLFSQNNNVWSLGAYGIFYRKNSNNLIGTFKSEAPPSTKNYDIIIHEIPIDGAKNTGDALITVTSEKSKIPTDVFDKLPPNVTYTGKTLKRCLDKKNLDVCCNFESDLDQKDIEPYKWLIWYDEKSNIFNKEMIVIKCGLIKPNLTAPNLYFKSVKVTAKINEKIVNQVIPSAVTSDGLIPKYNYREYENNNMEMWALEQQDLLGFGFVIILNSDAISDANISQINCLLIFVGVINYFLHR